MVFTVLGVLFVHALGVKAHSHHEEQQHALGLPVDGVVDVSTEPWTSKYGLYRESQ